MTALVAAWAAAVVVAVVLLVGGAVALRLHVPRAGVLVGLSVLAAALASVPLVPWAAAEEGAAGDCLRELPDGDVRRLPVVDCSERHRAQVFDVVELPPALDPGSPEALASRVFRICVSELERLEGRPYAEVDLTVQTVRPSPASLEDGDRRVLCLATSRDGGALDRAVG